MADTTLWPWESHSISAFRLFTLGWKNDRVFRWPMAVPAQNSKAPVLAPPGPGPDSGGGALGGPTWPWASEQAWLERAATSAPGRHRERISPGRAYLHCGHTRLGRTWAGPLCQHPTRRPRRRPKAGGTPLSPQRPGQAICPLPSPAADHAGRAIHVRSPARPREPGGPRRAVTWPRAPGSLGNLGPGAQCLDPGIRKQRKEGERTRLWRLQRRSRWSGGTCWLGGRSAQPELDQRLFRKREGGSSFFAQAWGGGAVVGRGDDDLVVTWDLQAVALAYVFVCCLFVRINIHPLLPRWDSPSHNKL